jgi:hypothetical protein
MCVVIDHPLEPFSWREFEQDIELCSYLQSSAKPVVWPIVDLYSRHHLWRAVCQSLERREPFTPMLANCISRWCSPWVSCRIVSAS